MQTTDLIKLTLANALSHWRQALQIFAIPLLTVLLILVTLSKHSVRFVDTVSQNFTTSYFLAFAAIPVVFILILWPVVAWHRLLILGEQPRGILPAFTFKPMMIYALKFVGLWIIVSLISFPISFIIAAVLIDSIDVTAVLAGERLPLKHTLLPILGSLPAIYLALRFCLALPGAAISSDVGISMSWAHTRSRNTNILVLALIYVAISLVVQLSLQAILPAPIEATSSTGLTLQVLSTAGQAISSLLVISLMSEMFRSFVPSEDKPEAE